MLYNSEVPKVMTAAVLHQAGGPEALRLEKVPVPSVLPHHALIRIRAAGLNRSELFTRQGHSPGVQLPRILGIECVGEIAVVDSGNSHLRPGDVVATAMGGLGRAFDGSYAQYVLVPVGQIKKLKVRMTSGVPSPVLGWDKLGALPEMLQTTWGSLFRSLRIKKGDRLLIRGGTTSIGLSAATIAKKHGCIVGSTTRSPKKADLLKRAGADQIYVDNGRLSDTMEDDEKYDKVLELIGTTTLEDSLRCTIEGGIVCMSGIVGNSWTLPDWNPMEGIPTAVCLTTYSGGSDDFLNTPFDELLNEIEQGNMDVIVGKTYALEDIVEAHHVMENNTAGGKIVILS
jgi:NADPH:quinone reductase-like Zn-dependent oxidoreductase